MSAVPHLARGRQGLGHGSAALMMSATCGHDLSARALFEAGADLEKVDNDLFTALMISAQKGHEQVARALLEKELHIGGNQIADMASFADAIRVSGSLPALQIFSLHVYKNNDVAGRGKAIAAA